VHKLLYLGLNPDNFSYLDYEIDHFPIIEVVPLKPASFLSLDSYSHLIFTSQTTVRLLEPYITKQQKEQMTVLVVGEATKKYACSLGYENLERAPVAQGEGIVQLIDKAEEGSSFFYPHSARARSLILDALIKKKVRYKNVELYTVRPTQAPLPDFTKYDLFYFTSTSTVEAFKERVGYLPPSEKNLSIGFLTQVALESCRLCSEL
jgi:uroporphyrinogen-III synthase